MRRSIATWLTLAIAAAYGVSQEPPVDPALPARLKELRAFVKNPKMDDDMRAYDAIEALTQTPEQRNPRDLDRIAEAIGEVLHVGKLRPADQTRLYDKATAALASMGKRGARPLRNAVTDERFKDRDYVRLRTRMIQALGATRDDGQVEFLLDLALRSPEDPVIAAAGEALGNFDELATPKVRDLVKRLISRYGELVMQSTQMESNDPNGPIDLGPQNARRTLTAIRGPWNATLAKLTGQSWSDAPEWQRWQNKNKDWTPPGRKN